MQLGMHLVYDVTHNTAKEEEHEVDGQKKKLLVHRKGATRAYPPGHESLPERYPLSVVYVSVHVFSIFPKAFVSAILHTAVYNMVRQILL